MGGLPSFNYNAINARGGIAEGLGGLTAALIAAPQEKRRLAMMEQDRITRQSESEQDRLMRQQQMADMQANRVAIGERDARDFEYRKTNDEANRGIAQQNATTASFTAGSNAVEGFQRGGGIMGLIAGKPKAGGRTPGPNDDVIPAHLLSNIEQQVDDEDAAMKASGGLSAQGMNPATRAHARQRKLEMAGYDPRTMRRLGAGTTNAAGQPASPQSAPPTPSAQPSAAPNQQAPQQSDADILELKKQHPQYATIPDAEFIRRVRAKTQGK